VLAERFGAVVRVGWRFALAVERFWRLPLDEPDDLAAELGLAADFCRDFGDFFAREARPLAALRRVEPPAAGRLRARPGERGVFDLAMTRPFLSNLDSFPISNVSSSAYRD
jgi:hypothetical protein